jgi:hypothetical protein
VPKQHIIERFGNKEKLWAFSGLVHSKMRLINRHDLAARNLEEWLWKNLN